MKKSVTSLLILASTFGCSSRVVVAPTAAPKQPELLSLSMPLIGKHGIAHACPVDGTILTAAHVAFEQYVTGSYEARGYVYTQGAKRGPVRGFNPAFTRDLAELLVDGGDSPEFVGRADAEPAIGDEVSWSQFNLTNNPLHQEIQKGKITDLGPGHFAFSPAPLQGSSGGCVFDSSGKVLGVLIWTIGLSPAKMRGVGEQVHACLFLQGVFVKYEFSCHFEQRIECSEFLLRC